MIKLNLGWAVTRLYTGTIQPDQTVRTLQRCIQRRSVTLLLCIRPVYRTVRQLHWPTPGLLYSTLRPSIQHCDDPQASTLHTPASHSVSSSPVYHPPRVKTNHPSHLYETASQHPPTERVLYKGWKSAV